jgi:hypothetical protein
MTTPSNLYAEKIFAEHPTAFWAMDGDADYISLISDANRFVNVWTASGATATTDTSDKNQNFTTAMSKLELASFPGSSGTYTFTSPNLFNLNQLDSAISSVTFGLHYLTSDDNVDKVEIGFVYNSTEYVSEFTSPNVSGEWQFVSKTINFSTSTSRNVQAIIRITYSSSGTQKATVFVNGLNIGVWSEEFVKTSSGQDSVSLPGSISASLSGISGVTSNSYGDTGKTGYYLVKNKTIRARNTSIPMVFGAENSTSLLSNDGSPSFIIPGQGFMHNIGRKETQTLEFWLRKNKEDGKVFGPVTTENGLYAADGSLVLRVGTYKTSYFVGEWSRPMLINICYETNRYSVLINGEEVMSLPVDSESITLSSTQPDWLGFYGFATGIEVDNVAIYPYIVSSIVAKRRFVYGQGVEYPLNVNSTYNGKSIFIDYRFAEYSNNYSYPNIGRWAQGTYDNVIPLDNALSLPEYNLPVFAVSSNSTNTAQDWLDYHAAGGVSMSGNFEFEPSGFDASGESTDLHVFFEKLSEVLNERVSGISGTFKINSGSGNRTLIRIVSRSSQSNISIKINNSGNVVCEIYTGSTLIETLPMLTAPSGNFMVGIDTDKISLYSPEASSLFQNHSDVSVYVGSKEDFSETAGDVEMLSFGFSTKKNMQKNFTPSSNGVITSTSSTNNYASYRLTPIEVVGSAVDNTVVPDVKVTAYWEDYVPLSVLAKTVFTDSSKTIKASDLDFIQFNLDSTGIEKTWISFQYLSDGANATQSSFGTSINEDVANKKIILPDILGWTDTRFAVSSGSIIYVPTEEDGSGGQPVDFNDLALVMHIEFTNVGVTYNPDIRVKALQLSSQSLNHNSQNYVNTLFSEPIYPITIGASKIYKAQNPFRIYKSSTPYLYLSSDTGIELAGYGLASLDLDGGSERALRILLSKSNKEGSLSSMQMAVRYGESSEFPDSETKIFTLETSDGTISFYMDRSTESGNTKRARIFAKKNNAEYFFNNDGSQAIEYHLNGKEVDNPVITAGEWAMLGITFPVPLTISSSNYLDLSGPLLFNNISYYQVDSTKLAEQVSYKKWQDVDNNTWGVVDNNTWQYWLISSAGAIISIDPSSIYDVYLGTNKIIADTYDASSPVLTVQDYEYIVYKDIKWQSQTILPT